MLSVLLSRLKKYWERFSGVEQKLLLVLFLIAIISFTFWQNQRDNEKITVADQGGTYTEGLVGQPQHINPLLAPANDVDSDLVRIIYAGLYEFDSNLNLVPDMAASMPEISADGKQYTITLKDNLRWHDGAPLTADDLIFTYQTIQDPGFSSPLRFSWNKVGLEKIDNLTIRLTLRESSATFIANLTVGIFPKHIWESVGSTNFALSKFNLEPIGSGPFQVTRIERGREGEIRSLQLESFAEYYKDQAYLDKLIFKFYETTDELIGAYQARNIQGLGYVPFDRNLFIKPRDSLQQIFLTLPQYQAVFINETKNPAGLGDVKIRKAIAKSVDKQKIIEEVYGGAAEQAFGPILPGHLGYHEQIPGAEMNIYDVGAAKSLLDEAGFKLDPETGFRKDDQDRILSLRLVTNSFSPNIRVAEMLKSMWEELGIQIVLSIEAIADLEENFIRPRNYELLLFSENVGADPDPFPFWHSSQVRDPGLNLTTFSNGAADKLLVDARINQPAESRAEKYRKFQEIFVGDVQAIFLNRSVFVYNVPTKIKGVNLNTVVTPADRFADIETWYEKTKRVKSNE